MTTTHNTAVYDRWAARLLVGLALGAFVLSYAGMYALALDSGYGWLSILWPLVTETAVVIFSLVYLVAKLKGYHNRTLMPLIVACTGLSVVFNIAHAPVVDYLSRAAWALPPLILFAAFKTYVWLIEQDTNRAGAIATIAELTARIGADRQAAEQLSRQIDNLTAKRDTLKAEVSVMRTQAGGNGPRFSEATIDKARVIFADRPGITGSAMGRAVGISERKGRDLLKLVRAEAGPVNGAGPARVFTNGGGS